MIFGDEFVDGASLEVKWIYRNRIGGKLTHYPAREEMARARRFRCIGELIDRTAVA